MLANTHDAAQAVLNRLKDAKEVVYDAETSGLDWRVNHCVGHVFTFGPAPEDTAYVPVRHAGGGNLPGLVVPTESDNWQGGVHPFETAFLKIIEERGTTIVGHHLAFDFSMLHKLGFRGRNPARDTMITAYLVNELRKSFSLDAVCRDEGVQEKKGEPLYQLMAEKFGGEPSRYKQMGNYWRTDASEFVVWDYAAGDGTSTYLADQSLVAKIYEPDHNGWTLDRVFDVECKLIPVLHRMRMRGVKIDEERLGQLIEVAEQKLEEGEAALGDLNVRAPTQMKAYFEKHGITDWPITEKGNASFKEEWLLTNEPGKKIVEVRKSKTLLSNFAYPTRDKHLYRGRVHPEYHQTRDEEFGTKTGRLSCTAPNLTAAPGKRQPDREEENGSITPGMGGLWRSCFVPDHGEWKEGDHDTCEIRIAAHYTGARVWLDGFLADPPIDPHTSVANEVGVIRQHAKTINLGLMTGQGKPALAAQLGVPMREGAAIVDKYFDGLPELKKFQYAAKDRFANRGYVTTLLGRRIHLESRRFAYRAVNRLTQGGNADLIKTNMIDVDEVCEAMGGTLHLSVHDSLSWQGGDDEMDREIIRVMTDTETGPIRMRCPLSVSVGKGKTWAEATFFEED